MIIPRKTPVTVPSEHRSNGCIASQTANGRRPVRQKPEHPKAKPPKGA